MDLAALAILLIAIGTIGVLFYGANILSQA